MTRDLANFVNPHGGCNKARRLVWSVAAAILFRPTPRWCLAGWRRFLLRLFGARIGRGCRVHGLARIWNPANVTVGDGSWIDDRADLYSVDRIVLGSNCVVSREAVLCTASHDYGRADFRLKTGPVVLEDGVWVSMRAIVLPGVTLHEGAVVGAGAVVTRDVPPYAVVAGNPAKVVKRYGSGAGGAC